MSANWKDLYNELIQYKDTHDSIRISSTSTAMFNDEEREEFYRIFQEVRNAYVVEHFTKDVELIQDLIANWKTDSAKLVEVLELEELTVPYHMQQLIDNPIEELALTIYNPFFEVIKGNKTFEELDEIALKKVEEEITLFKTSLYKWWIEVRVLLFLEPSELHATPEILETLINGIAVEYRFEDVLPLEPTNKIVFKNPIQTHLFAPYIAVFSNKYEKYVSIGDFFDDCVWIAKQRNTNQQWIGVNEIKELYGSVDNYPKLALYISDAITDLEIYGDRFSLCQPDVVIDYVLDDEWNIEQEIHSAKRHSIIMQPKLGAILISKNDFNKDQVEEALQPHIIDWNLFHKSQYYKVIYPKSAINKDVLAEIPSMDGIEKPASPFEMTNEEVKEALIEQSYVTNEPFVDKFANAENPIGTTEYRDYLANATPESDSEVAEAINTSDDSTEDQTLDEEQDQEKRDSDEYVVKVVKGAFYTRFNSIDNLPESNLVKELYDREELMDKDYQGAMEPELNIKVAKVCWDVAEFENDLDQMISNK